MIYKSRKYINERKKCYNRKEQTKEERSSLLKYISKRRPVDLPVSSSTLKIYSSQHFSVGRPEHQVRPTSAGSSRNLDVKAPFLSHGPLIGRNFDEDERKPLDGLLGFRRPIVDESPHAQPSHPVDSKVGRRAVSSPAISSVGRVSQVPNVKLNYQTNSGNSSYRSNYPVMGSNAGQAMAGSYPNAWGARKEAASIKEPVPVAWSGPDFETKLSLASALEKVSSGGWNSKQHVHSPKDANVPVVEEKAYSEKSLDNPEVLCSLDYGEEVPAHDKVRSTARLDFYERNTLVAVNGLQSVVLSESSERPRLKLLPRSNPIEVVEPATDYKQTSNEPRVADSYAGHESKISLHYSAAGPMVVDGEPERIKLNLKPRSQTSEQPEGNKNSKRGTVLGGAELERGVEDGVSSYESQSPLRVKVATPKTDTPTHLPPARHNEKTETNSTNRRLAAKYPERHQPGPNKSDPHSRYRPGPSEIRKNSRQEGDQNWNQLQKRDRAPSPETWRKPVGPAGPGHTPPVYYGKAASAVELAQAFSKSVQGRGQVPFSR